MVKFMIGWNSKETVQGKKFSHYIVPKILKEKYGFQKETYELKKTFYNDKDIEVNLTDVKCSNGEKLFVIGKSYEDFDVGYEWLWKASLNEVEQGFDYVIKKFSFMDLKIPPHAYLFFDPATYTKNGVVSLVVGVSNKKIDKVAENYFSKSENSSFKDCQPTLDDFMFEKFLKNKRGAKAVNLEFFPKWDDEGFCGCLLGSQIVIVEQCQNVLDKITLDEIRSAYKKTILELKKIGINKKPYLSIFVEHDV